MIPSQLGQLWGVLGARSVDLLNLKGQFSDFRREPRSSSSLEQGKWRRERREVRILERSFAEEA